MLKLDGSPNWPVVIATAIFIACAAGIFASFLSTN